MSGNRTSRETGFTGTGVARAKEQMPVDCARESRVAELRDRYRAGLYRLDARTIAAAIIDQHLAAAKQAR